MRNISIGITFAEARGERLAWRKRLSTAAQVVTAHVRRCLCANGLAFALLLRQELPLFLGQLLVPLGLALSPLLMSYGIGQVLAAVLGDGDLSIALWILVLAVMIGSIFPMLSQMVERELSDWVFGHIKSTLVQHIATLDPARYGDPALKNLFQRVCHRVTWKFTDFFRSQTPLLRASVAAVAAGIVVGSWSVALVLMLVICIAPSMIVEAKFAQAHFRLDEKQGTGWRRFWEDFGFTTHAPSLAFLQALGAARSFSKAFAGRTLAQIREYRDLNVRYLWLRIATTVVGQAGVCAALVILVRDLAAGTIDASGFVLYLGSVSVLAGSISELAGAIGQQVGLSFYVQDWSQLLEVSPSFLFPERGLTTEAGAEGMGVSVQNLRFAFPDNGKASRDVLRGVSFTIPAGEKWALVGFNGAGKSTLQGILAGLYRPTGGSVTLGGVSVNDFDEPTLRRLVAFLPQSFQRYIMTVKEYIALGIPGEPIDMERVREAARKSGAARFIERWPDGYDQLLGRDYDGAEEPSGGQLQKLALAMMFYKASPLLILDEPTAAIDPESAKEFWDLLLTGTPAQTVLFSTHYLGAVKRADRILVLDAGKVVGQGSHADLMNSCAPYRRIFNAQAHDFLPAETPDIDFGLAPLVATVSG